VRADQDAAYFRAQADAAFGFNRGDVELGIDGDGVGRAGSDFRDSFRQRALGDSASSGIIGVNVGHVVFDVLRVQACHIRVLQKVMQLKIALLSCEWQALLRCRCFLPPGPRLPFAPMIPLEQTA
jgi:hypothetical protein